MFRDLIIFVAISRQFFDNILGIPLISPHNFDVDHVLCVGRLASPYSPFPYAKFPANV